VTFKRSIGRARAGTSKVFKDALFFGVGPNGQNVGIGVDGHRYFQGNTLGFSIGTAFARAHNNITQIEVYYRFPQPFSEAG